MAKYMKLDNPTLDAREFKIGDFARFLVRDGESSVGIVTRTTDEDVAMICFEEGFPYCPSAATKYGTVKKVTKDEALARFSLISNRFERSIEEGGLPGAFSARKHYHFNTILDRITSDEMDPYAAATTAVEDPKTGLYVLMGIYSGQGPSEHLEGLVVTPRLSERKVSEAIIKIKPNGFGNIPNDVYNTPATSHGLLVAMRSCEIPERARELVVNPKRLKSVGSEWVFSETFAKE